MKRFQGLAPLLTFAIGILLGLSSQQGAEAQASNSVRQAATQFASALSKADATGTQAVTTPQLWARLSTSFTPQTKAGAFGSFTVDPQGWVITKDKYSFCTLLCTHPDGVEDLVIITLKQSGGVWKVSGGPAAMSSSKPLG